MNKIAIVSVLAVMTGLAGAPQTAKARGDDTALAIVGGFIGGVLIANAINDSHYDHVYCEFDGCGDRYVVAHSHSGRHHEWITVKVWVPGRWIVRIDDRGHR